MWALSKPLPLLKTIMYIGASTRSSSHTSLEWGHRSSRVLAWHDLVVLCNQCTLSDNILVGRERDPCTIREYHTWCTCLLGFCLRMNTPTLYQQGSYKLVTPHCHLPTAAMYTRGSCCFSRPAMLYMPNHRVSKHSSKQPTCSGLP